MLHQEPTERFHSHGQHLCKFIGNKESVCIRKEFNSHRILLVHQHGRRFIVLEHQYGRREVVWKRSIITSKHLLIRNHEKALNAACHSRGTKPPCWNAKVVLGQDQQKAYIILTSNVLCFSCPSATFASQHGSFVPREWQAAKVLLYQTTSVVYVIFTAILHCHDITLKNSFTDKQFSMQTKLMTWTKRSLFSLLLTEHMVRKQT